MTEPFVTIRSREDGPVSGYTTVYAEVDGGDTGEYMIASRFCGTPVEVDEIRAQSAQRQETRAATRPGGE